MAELTSTFDALFFRDQSLPLHYLARSVVSGWRLVLLSAVAATLLAAAVLRLVPAEYTATMVVGPIARTGAAAMGARAPVAMRSGVALSPLEFGSGEETLSDFTRFIELLDSPAVALRLMADASTVRHMFPERWDVSSGRWHTPGGLTGWFRWMIFGLAGREDWAEPDATTVARLLRRNVVVQSLGTNPMRRITYRDSDRAFATMLLTRLTAAADAHLRAEAGRRARTEIAFIRAHLGEIVNSEYRKAMADHALDQERVVMMIEADLPFAADLVESASAANHPDFPNPMIILPLALAGGTGLGLFMVFALAAWRDRARVSARQCRITSGVV
ncbi:MAG: Wzz/FepE/Etk N-terminal domain-containing protein [Rhodospirillaceae bacterium]